MNPSSGTACIAYGLAILFVLLSPVTGQGFAFDSSSCSLEAMSYLRDKFQRAARISENSGNVLDFPGPRGDYTWIAQSLMDPLRHILGGVTPAIAVEVLRGVFTKWSNPDLWLDTRVGIASYWNYLGVFDSRATPRPSRVDRQGNLLVYCNDNRLGRVEWDHTNLYQTSDRDSGILYAQPYQECAEGSRAFLIHAYPGRADRVTVCDWLLQSALQSASQGVDWSTTINIIEMRNDLPDNPSTGRVQPELVQFIEVERNGLLPEDLAESYNSPRGLTDMDLSIGFDTWLIYVFAKCYAGGYKQDINNQQHVYPSATWAALDGFIGEEGNLVNQDYAVTYMVAAQG
ncbi:hypothetical protein IMSHALPRED_005942 [Imshaugia aleurites]|uniref:Uncharacterized protein n=1 Tax=Imshaugia aleurites TaxID=172621 RepID=A0A8H3FIN0_9LECA|nr:hypothetical protein IMSHALPRED_005942 [Imshaugia aleurites]